MNANAYLPLRLRQVSLGLQGNPCLHSVDTTIETLGITAIIGANGAGKTLLLKLLAGLLTPTEGRIEWQQTPLAPAITWVPTQARLLNRSVVENLLLPLQHHRHPEPRLRCQQALAWAAITDLELRQVSSLSTGEQQLLALARAWALAPEVLLLDEPTANLDPQRQAQLNTLISELSHTCKIIVTSHSMAQVRQLAADILWLDHGKLRLHLPKDLFFASPEVVQFADLSL